MMRPDLIGAECFPIQLQSLVLGPDCEVFLVWDNYGQHTRLYTATQNACKRGLCETRQLGRDASSLIKANVVLDKIEQHAITLRLCP